MKTLVCFEQSACRVDETTSLHTWGKKVQNHLFESHVSSISMATHWVVSIQNTFDLFGCRLVGLKHTSAFVCPPSSTSHRLASTAASLRGVYTSECCVNASALAVVCRCFCGCMRLSAACPTLTTSQNNVLAAQHQSSLTTTLSV